MSEAQGNNGSWVCSSCGHENEGKFCMFCGQPRPQQVETVSPGSMTETDNSWVCSCGQRNEGKFCIVCGSPREKNDLAQMSTEFEPTAPVQTTVSLEKTQTMSDQTEPILEQTQTVPVQTATALEDTQTIPSAGNAEQSAQSKAGAKRRSVHINPKVMAAIGIVVVLVLGVAGGVLAKFYFGVEATSTDIPFTGETRDKGSVAAMNSWANAESDLSLEGVSLGDKLDKVHEMLGTELSSTGRVGGQTYSFTDLDIRFRNDVVDDLTSKTEEARTKKGIHHGSIEDEVLQAYGQEFKKVSLGSDTAYDYTLKLNDDSTGTLRFIINNGKVKSIRVWRNMPASASTAANTPFNAAVKVMQNYHQAITNRQYKQAYGMLTNREQNQMGVYDNFVKGYANTIYSSVSQFKQVSTSPNRVVLTYTLTAKDRADGGKVLVQTFSGTATLVLKGNVWLIDEKSSKKTGSRME